MSHPRFGYPLRNPQPDGISGLEGLRVGDVGRADAYGRSDLAFNITSSPKELQGEIPGFPLFKPDFELAFKPGEVFMAGVERILDDRRYHHITVLISQFLHSGIPRADYAFNMTSNEGAIVILPDGASRWELDKAQVQELKTYVNEYALEMCKFANKDTLYLVTAVFKSKYWTLGSFYDEFKGGQILVHR